MQGHRRPEWGGVPFRGAERRTTVPEAIGASGMSGENVSKNLKTSVILDSIFVTITHKKNVNVRDLIWDANLALFNEIP